VTLREIGLLLASVLTAVAGQLLLKTGALKLGKVNAENVVSHILSILLIPELVFGLMLYGLSSVMYILLLTRVNLSVVGPAVAIGYIFSVLAGYFIFREAIPPSRLLGLGFIVCGVILVVWKQ